MTPPSDVDEVTLAPEAILRAVMLSLCDDYPTLIRALKATRALTKLSQSRAAAAEGDDSGKRKAEGEIFIIGEPGMFEEPYWYGYPTFHLRFQHVGTLERYLKWNGSIFLIGNLEPDYEGDFCADHDEGHAEIDTEDMKRECPEGFIYDCCDENGESKGCAKSRHQEQPSKSLRGGYGLD
ncbi:unnamed protein product [Parascedosporium putredinis]|uniref:Uncharacterized protein n=1 Tax=Parascedosporium putredinis TaxID=1442378 RepID=A0A9P1GXE4_9PEZI|nr:unnamed protein product [Parascedosporium putredinis]CAI7989673.1 unnamed protein product [Parascedosporium putredinis]